MRHKAGGSEERSKRGPNPLQSGRRHRQQQQPGPHIARLCIGLCMCFMRRLIWPIGCGVGGGDGRRVVRGPDRAGGAQAAGLVVELGQALLPQPPALEGAEEAGAACTQGQQPAPPVPACLAAGQTCASALSHTCWLRGPVMTWQESVARPEDIANRFSRLDVADLGWINRSRWVVGRAGGALTASCLAC